MLCVWPQQTRPTKYELVVLSPEDPPEDMINAITNPAFGGVVRAAATRSCTHNPWTAS